MHEDLPALTPRRRALIVAALLTGTFLSSIEVTIVSAAMPTIVGSLGGLSLYPWVFTTYLLAQTITIPVWGRFADLFGRRRTYAAGVALFLFGSAACGLAPTMESLILARLLQGLGGGSLLPLTMTIFGDLYPVEQRTRMQGLFALIWGLSSVMGPAAGGLIVMVGSWRPIFWINLPFGVAASAVILALLPEHGASGRARIDWAGTGLLSAGVLMGLLALLPPEQRPGPAWLFGVAALALTAGFVAVERRVSSPLLPLDLLRDRVQATVNTSGVLLGTILFGIVGFLPLYVQAILGATPVWAGAALVPATVFWTLGSLIGGRLVMRFGFQALVRTGASLLAVGLVIAALGIHARGVVPVMGALALYGAGMGLCISTFTVSVQERAPRDQRGIATALSQFSRSIGGTIGVTALGALMNHQLGGSLDRKALFDGGEIAPELVARLAPALDAVFSTVAALGLAAALIILLGYPRVRLQKGTATSHEPLTP